MRRRERRASNARRNSQASVRLHEQRTLSSLVSVGPATLRDFELLGIRSVADLARADPRELYERLCVVTQVRHDPCAEDVFAAAVAQARDPELPVSKCRWWYWSDLRKNRPSTTK